MGLGGGGNVDLFPNPLHGGGGGGAAAEHATSHESGGDDEMDVSGLTGLPTSATFELGGGDEILGTNLSSSIGTVTNENPVTPDVDADGGTVHHVTVTGDHVINAPLNADLGQSGCVFIEQGAGGPHAPTFHADYDFGATGAPSAGDYSTTAGKIDRLDWVKDPDGGFQSTWWQAE